MFGSASEVARSAAEWATFQAKLQFQPSGTAKHIFLHIWLLLIIKDTSPFYPSPFLNYDSFNILTKQIIIKTHFISWLNIKQLIYKTHLISWFHNWYIKLIWYLDFTTDYPGCSTPLLWLSVTISWLTSLASSSAEPLSLRLLIDFDIFLLRDIMKLYSFWWLSNISKFEKISG